MTKKALSGSFRQPRFWLEQLSCHNCRLSNDFRALSHVPVSNQLKALLRGDVDRLCEFLGKPTASALAGYAGVVLIGSGVYGFTLGLWRAPLQALYTAIKFPLVIFLTCLGNGAINGMLAQILGSGLSFRQTAVAILMSFAIAAIILAGFAPLTLFVWFNAPPLDSKGAILGHSVMTRALARLLRTSA